MMPHSSPAKAGVGKEGSQSVKLVLGYDWLKREQKRREEGFKGWFTESQWQELYLQAVIFKYFQAGLSVPLHLVPPIRRSVSRQRPGLMDGEPWRCRRTDGKRWRCRKRAILDQKYCEPHMHRGKNRSRKLVEAAAAPYYQSSISNSDVHSPIKQEQMFTRMPLTPHPKFLSSTATKNTCADSKPSIASPFATQESNCFCTYSSKHHNSLMSFYGVGVDLNSHIPPVAPAGYMKRVKFNNMNMTATRTNQSHIFTAQLDGVTPYKCGLQHDAGQRRCTRSDGKKWQCKRPTVGEHNYCEEHLHRGSSMKKKKMMMPTSSSTNPVTVALPPPQPSSMVAYRIPHPLAIATRYIDDGNDDDGCTSLDTKLSIAPLSHRRELKCDSTTHTRSSGDSTTITDDETTPTSFVR